MKRCKFQLLSPCSVVVYLDPRRETFKNIPSIAFTLIRSETIWSMMQYNIALKTLPYYRRRNEWIWTIPVPTFLSCCLKEFYDITSRDLSNSARSLRHILNSFREFPFLGYPAVFFKCKRSVRAVIKPSYKDPPPPPNSQLYFWDEFSWAAIHYSLKLRQIKLNRTFGFDKPADWNAMDLKNTACSVDFIRDGLCSQQSSPELTVF